MVVLKKEEKLQATVVGSNHEHCSSAAATAVVNIDFLMAAKAYEIAAVKGETVVEKQLGAGTAGIADFGGSGGGASTAGVAGIAGTAVVADFVDVAGVAGTAVVDVGCLATGKVCRPVGAETESVAEKKFAADTAAPELGRDFVFGPAGIVEVEPTCTVGVVSVGTGEAESAAASADTAVLAAGSPDSIVSFVALAVLAGTTAVAEVLLVELEAIARRCTSIAIVEAVSAGSSMCQGRATAGATHIVEY